MQHVPIPLASTGTTLQFTPTVRQLNRIAGCNIHVSWAKPRTQELLSLLGAAVVLAGSSPGGYAGASDASSITGLG
eukprot:COSAG06_NODE_6052_length_3134_cov_15.537068_3_plen_76_part_00